MNMQLSSMTLNVWMKRLLAGVIIAVLFELVKQVVASNRDILWAAYVMAIVVCAGTAMFVAQSYASEKASGVPGVAAVEKASVAMLVTDAQGRIRHVNPSCARLTGYTAKELIGKDTKIFRSGRH